MYKLFFETIQILGCLEAIQKFVLAWNNKSYLVRAYFWNFLFLCWNNELHGSTGDSIFFKRKSIVIFQQEHTQTTYIVWRRKRSRFGQGFSTNDQVSNQNGRCHNLIYRRFWESICYVIIYWLYVFNISCAEKLRATLHLIQKLFLEIASGVRRC